MTKNEFDESIKKNKEDLTKNDFLKTPSIYVLEKSAKKLLDLLEPIRDINETSDTEFLSLKMDLDIFITDLPGELNHDYKNQNKRYREKWSKEKRKLNEFISRFRTILPDTKSN